MREPLRSPERGINNPNTWSVISSKRRLSFYDKEESVPLDIEIVGN